MYVPRLFALPADEIAPMVRANPFATLFTSGSLGPYATHVPLLLDGPDRLVGHVARSNPHTADLEGPALAVFAGPHAFVSSRWYGTPAEHVPTWNYVAVHATGTLRRLEDPLPVLAASMAAFQPEDPIPSGDAERDDFVRNLSAAVVAFELRVERWEGKAKLSQNRDPDDVERVRAALDHEVAAWMGRR
ncbi:MAG: FMN-binding negative transcriptional regulator [Myxococcales bacterium]|nr:FMN-binding negative transcriptional regulator [Myxococcales bacterium]